MYKVIDKNALRVKRHLRQKGHISGTATCPRVSVYRSNKAIYAQLIDDVTHTTLAATSSLALNLTDGANVEGAKKVGAKLADIAKEKGIEAVVFDRSGYVYHGRIKALAEALREGGIKF